MAYYKTAYVNIPFLCKWECVHCAKQNVGKGVLPVRGDTVSYYPGYGKVREEREQAVTQKSLQGVANHLQPVCDQFLCMVNLNKRYHKALASVQPRCVVCGKRQPWQVKNWTGTLGTLLVGCMVLLIALSALTKFIPEFAVDPELLVGCCMGLSALIIGLILFVPIIQEILANLKMKRIGNDACYPQVALPEQMIEKAKEISNHPEESIPQPQLWTCRQCGEKNPVNHSTCVKCGSYR